MKAPIFQERKVVRAELLQCLQQIDYAAFEQVIKRLLYKSGYVTVQSIGRTHKRGRTPQGGLDLTARSITDLSSVLTVAQIKQYKRVVSRRFVDELRGTMLRLGAEQGLLVTLSRFSKVAHAATLESNVAPIKLIEGDEVLDLLFAYRIGVCEENGKWSLDSVYLDRLQEKAIGTYGQIARRNRSKKSKPQKHTSVESKRSPNKTTLPDNNLHGTDTYNPTNAASTEGGEMTWSIHVMAGLSSLWILERLPGIQHGNLVLFAGAAALGALLPDLDAPRSKISQLSVGGIKPFLLPAQAVNRMVGHRSLLHSLLALVYMAFVGAICAPFIGWQVALAFWLGYASHLATDACTRSGIPFLYPKPRRFHLLPKPLRIVTGSSVEEVIFVALAMLVLILFLSNFATLSA